MPLDLVQTLSDLVSIPSVNPMGRGLSGPEFFETEVTRYLEETFVDLEVPYQRQQVEPDRDNIVAFFRGEVAPEEGGQVLLWEAHQDTVPVDGMTIDPFAAKVKDGRLYGRGACDIKGGLTAMLSAFSRLVEERPEGRPTILLACTVNEEHGYSGARELGFLWEPGTESIFPRRPDAAIVAEPTNLQVVVAHKGALRWNVRTHGRATHSSQPHLGDNALYKMAHVLLALEAYQQEYIPTLPKHHLCGSPSLSVGTISGGISVNTVPDECAIEVDRRILPGEDSQAVFRHVQDWLAERAGLTGADIEHDQPWMWGDTLADDCNGPLADSLCAAVEATVGRCEKIGVPYGTNASRISAAGVPCVVFGPGSIDQAHTADEWISLDELQQAADCLYAFGCQGLKS